MRTDRCATRSILAVFAALSSAVMLPAIAAGQATSLSQLHFPALPPQQILQAQRIVLKNGMVVMLFEDHELPLVEGVALIHTGSRLEATEKSGLAEITGTLLLTGGTERMTAAELDDFLDSKAAHIETTIDEDFGRATMDSLKGDFPEVLKVFADVLRRPAFAEDQLQVVKNLATGGVARQNDSQRDILFREFKRAVYGKDSPYSRFPTFASIAGVRRQDVVAWHRAYFQPNRVVLGLVGDFRREEAVKLVEAAFGDWPAGPARKDPEVSYRRQPAPGVYYVEKNDVTQSAIVMGGLGIVNRNPDYYALEVMNRVMAGSFSARLFSSIRTGKSLSYMVFGEVGGEWDHAGITQLFMNTKTQSTGEGIEALLEQAKDMVARPPTDAEVAKTKQAIRNSFIFEHDSKRKILEQEVFCEYYGYPLDWLDRYLHGIEAVTPEQVRVVAAKYLHPEQFTIVVVGPSKGLDKPLSTFGPVTPIDITIPPPPVAQP
ncbi:MAG TPA: pitrilysin family protein [Thermoanaerobaculia bacterium]|jgi:zinc protease|nr:pitrilysin family protein [Thermoanaerobaculia bacterium]